MSAAAQRYRHPDLKWGVLSLNGRRVSACGRYLMFKRQRGGYTLYHRDHGGQETPLAQTRLFAEGSEAASIHKLIGRVRFPS